MAIKWIKTAHKGLRYYEHQNRRHGKKRDRYYAIRFKVANKDYSYGVGWWSEGIPDETMKEDPQLGFEEYALKLLRQYQGNIKAGSGTKSPKEKRKIAWEKAAHEKAEQERLEKEAVTFDELHHQADLVHVGCDHDYRSVPGTRRDHVADGVDADLVCQRGHLLRQDGSHRVLIPRHPVGVRELGEQSGDVLHRWPP